MEKNRLLHSFWIPFPELLLPLVLSRHFVVLVEPEVVVPMLELVVSFVLLLCTWEPRLGDMIPALI